MPITVASHDRSSANGTDQGGDARIDAEPSGRGEGERSIHLEATVVRYENRPDRCTVFPKKCPEEEKPTTWLSADLSAFVDLEEAR